MPSRRTGVWFRDPPSGIREAGLGGAATALNVHAAYETCYPGALDQLGIPVGIGTDPSRWANWLGA